MKNILLVLTLTLSSLCITAAQEQSSGARFVPMPMRDRLWFLEAGGRYLAKCTDAEMTTMQEKYQTLQCRRITSSADYSFYTIVIPGNFSGSLLEQLRKENININKPQAVFPCDNKKSD